MVSFRHNELRDLNIELAKAAGFNMCTKEPVIKEAGIHGEVGSCVDWSVRGFWEHQIQVLFDCHIMNADTPSYANKPLDNTFESQRNAKKQQYSSAVIDRRDLHTIYSKL